MVRFGASRRLRRPLWRQGVDLVLAGVILLALLVIVVRLERLGSPPSRGVAIVNDGDSITLNGERVRLRGIDAPELFQTCRRDGKDYACGRAARDALVRLIGGRAVSCRMGERDKYQRLLAYCQVGETDLNAAQVAAGWAVSFGGFEMEEAAARRAKAGVWAGDFERPAEWRATHGRTAEPHHDAPAPWSGRLGDWLSSLFGG